MEYQYFLSNNNMGNPMFNSHTNDTYGNNNQ